MLCYENNAYFDYSYTMLFIPSDKNRAEVSRLNPLTPEFLKRAISYSDLEMLIDANRSKIKNIMANNVVSDETAR